MIARASENVIDFPGRAGRGRCRGDERARPGEKGRTLQNGVRRRNIVGNQRRRPLKRLTPGACLEAEADPGCTLFCNAITRFMASQSFENRRDKRLSGHVDFKREADDVPFAERRRS